MNVADIDFDYVAQIRHEYMNVFLDSQMLIEDRIKFAGEIPKLLGNFERLLHAVNEIYPMLATQVMHTDEARAGMETLRQIASAWPDMRNPE